MAKKKTIALGLPWYMGPDVDCFDEFFAFLFYLGRLQERSWWMANSGIPIEALPPLIAENAEPEGELTPEDGQFEFLIAKETRCSLVGRAREEIVDMCLTADADYLFMWDADMRFKHSTFLRMMRHKKLIVNALAFTSRMPIQPCLYTINIQPQEGGELPWLSSETVFDYPKNKLITDEDVNGHLAFGTGVVLFDMTVFDMIPKPWFNATGCGEDWFFNTRAMHYKVPRYCDTSIKVFHKGHAPTFIGEPEYEKDRKEKPEVYEALKEIKVPEGITRLDEVIG
jgi:hypothetical protein